MFAPAPEEAEISVSNGQEQPPAARKRGTWVGFAALLALIAPGVIAWKLLADREQEAAPPPARAPIATAPEPVAVAVAEPVVAPIDAAVAASEPASRTTTKRSPAPPPRRAKPVRMVDETPRAEVKREPVPAPATPAATAPVVTPAPAPVQVPIAPAPPVVVAPAPAPVVPVGPGSLDAVASIASISVDGPLPDSEVQSAVTRVLGVFRDCYRGAAKQAGKTPLLKIKITFAIDEGRAAQNLRVSGDTLGVGSCVRNAASKLRTRVAPDVGTAGVSVVVKFTPVGA
jgi:eukaryotic-like serine/threonine-protein kinase